MEFYDENMCDQGAIQDPISSNGDSSRADTLTSWEGETMVGFDDEAAIIKEQLIRGPLQRKLTFIGGMPGLGKTTLTRNVYNDPFVIYHFDIRAWVYVSQEYQKRDLLLRLLSSLIHLCHDIDQMSDEKLAQQLHNHLSGNRYLIVMDDIWDDRAWIDLRNYLPNDHNGSRIMFTTRIGSLTLDGQFPRPLRFLSHDESWDLLRRKVLQGQTCPSDLMEIGKEIAKKCQGLPLTIVVVAGILASEEKKEYRWKQVGETINSWMANNEQLWVKTIAMSYNHLPDHLRPCFLYFGAFPEDSQIPVRKLIRLWVAEGFIPRNEDKIFEDVAKEYLMDLIGRSLVLASRRGYDGEVKACSIHDLLRDFCLKKAEQVHFLKRILDYQDFFASASTSSLSTRQLCIDSEILRDADLIPPALGTQSLLFIASGSTAFSPTCFLPRCFRILKVLDMSSIKFFKYHKEIEELVLLRYLAIEILLYTLPESISNLWNLETLILQKRSSITLPRSIRKMAKLRHIALTGTLGVHKLKRQDPDDSYPFSLDNLQTLSWVDPSSWEDILDSTPNLRKLGFRGDMIGEEGLTFPHLDFLTHLQKLKVFNTSNIDDSNKIGGIRLPTSLKKLTLKETRLDWDELSTLGKLLPNLESLKLLYRSCSGPCWETSDCNFPRLKFLKFKSLGIVWWNASRNQFPSLQQLALVRCFELQNIPPEVGNVPTLRMIEVRECNQSVADSTMEIKKVQESKGNNRLQIIVSRGR